MFVVHEHEIAFGTIDT